MKAILSQPMAGKTEEEIVVTRLLGHSTIPHGWKGRKMKILCTASASAALAACSKGGSGMSSRRL